MRGYKMVMITDQAGIERFHISKEEDALINRIKDKIYQEDSQVLGIVWGGVGSGKSLKAQYWGYAIDPTLEISRVCFNIDEFIEAVTTSKKKVIICDEGISLFFSRASMTKEGRLMGELMAQIRQKNLCILICVPELTSIDWLVVKQANFVAYVWETVELVEGKKVTYKGNVAVYPEISGANFKSKIYQYLKLKRRNIYAKIRKPEPAFHIKGNPIGPTRKQPWYPVGEEAYRAKKEAILDKYKSKVEGVGIKKTELRQKLNLVRKEIKKSEEKEIIARAVSSGLKRKDIAIMLGCNPSTVNRKMLEYNISRAFNEDMGEFDY